MAVHITDISIINHQHGVRYRGLGGLAPPPQFLEKINEFLKFTIDF